MPKGPSLQATNHVKIAQNHGANSPKFARSLRSRLRVVVLAKMSAADKDAEIAALRQQNATLQARVKELETGTARLSVRLSGEWGSSLA